MYFSKNRSLILIICLCISIFTFKWSLSFLFYNEDIFTKILYESKIDGDGAFYFPFIKFLSSLNFSNSFDPFTNNLKNLPIPYGSIFMQSIFYKFLGFSGFIIIEILAVFLFIFSIFGIVFNIIYYLFGPEAPRGIYAIIVLILFLGSTNLLFLSILSEYICKILEETKKRPQFIIKEIINDNKKT